MTSIEFVKQKLHELVNIFPNIKCAYEFDAFDNTHTVEIMPSEFYNNSQAFFTLSDEIEKKFVEKFPYEGLYFIDNKSIIPISDVIYEVKGRDYNIELSYSIANPQTVCIPAFNNIPSFLNNHSKITKEFIKETFTINSLNDKSNQIRREKINYIKPKDLAHILEKNVSNESLYAMAA